MVLSSRLPQISRSKYVKEKMKILRSPFSLATLSNQVIMRPPTPSCPCARPERLDQLLHQAFFCDDILGRVFRPPALNPIKRPPGDVKLQDSTCFLGDGNFYIEVFPQYMFIPPRFLPPLSLTFTISPPHFFFVFFS